jgi:hypothetical protein
MASRCLPVRAVAALVVALPVLAQAPAAPVLEWIATERVGRLTACPTNPIAEVGLAGTDLGVSFEASGRLVFLFGDSWTLDKRDWDADSVAWARPTAPGRAGVPVLEWARREGGRFLPLAPKGVQLGGMNVPVEGFAVGDRTYVFFDGGWDGARARHTSSLLAHTRKLEFEALELDHVALSDKVRQRERGAGRSRPVDLRQRALSAQRRVPGARARARRGRARGLALRARLRRGRAQRATGRRRGLCGRAERAPRAALGPVADGLQLEQAARHRAAQRAPTDRTVERAAGDLRSRSRPRLRPFHAPPGRRGGFRRRALRARTRGAVGRRVRTLPRAQPRSRSRRRACT